jgi:basic membrane protein A and related proteins
MRKRLLLLLSLLLSFSLIAAACGNDDSTTDAGSGDDGGDTGDAGDADTGDDDMADSISVSLIYDIGGRGDQSFNDSAFAGAERAAEELGITFTEASPNDDGSNRAELLQLGADASDLVVAVGFLFEGDVAAVGAENADTSFGVIDSVMLDFSQDPPVPYGENIAGTGFREEQGSFLVGAAAALKSESGKIGFIGGVSGVGGLIERFEAGYIAGAKAVNPDIEILSEYVTAAPDFDGFNAPDRGKEIGLAMYEDGADVVYHAAGGTGAGLFEAAKDHSDMANRVWAIGVDSDQYLTADPAVQEFILTSMLKRVDVAVYTFIKAVVDGTFTGGPTTYDLAIDGVGYSTSGGFIDDIVPQLEEFKAQIIAGDIVVPTVPE